MSYCILSFLAQGTGDFAMEKEILHGLEKFVNDLEIRLVSFTVNFGSNLVSGYS